MINKDSILFSITITFIISFLLITLSFMALYKSSQNRETYFASRINMDATRTFMRGYKHEGMSQDLRDELLNMGFEVILDASKQEKILSNKDITDKHSYHKKGMRLVNFTLNDKNYIYIHSRYVDVILKNNQKIQNHNHIIATIFILILLSFIAFYITTIRKLKPLKTLQDKVKDFGKEEFDIECATAKKDEISLLANEFDASAKKLKKLKESRNIFIRNIMHELKTPITKGRFLVELPQTEQNKEMMQKVFYRLESLIAEFASIEELISSKKALEKKEYFLADVIDNAMDILMCEEDEVNQEYENIRLNVDFNLFCIAIKNLLDNGIKYSKEKTVTVKTQQNSIVFQNKGDRLAYPLESYFEPFFKGDNIKSNQSFGLGLYIVKHILDANGYELEYVYENGVNRFIVK